MKEDNEYVKCPFCNQMTRQEDLNNGTHICWDQKDNSHKTLGIWDEG
jgi:acetyl-CoA carboxylase beta subunit